MITKLKITEAHIPQHRSDNPICLALYRGMKNAKGDDYFYGDYIGKVAFDVVQQCYWIWTGEYGRLPAKAGELLHGWLSAWYHGKEIFPITIRFMGDTAEVEVEDKGAFFSFWQSPNKDASKGE